MKRLIIILLCLWSSILCAKISVQIEPSPVKIGETFRLVLAIDNPKDQSMPDLTPLQHDFTILGTERSISYSIINGTTSASNQWIILLSANHEGSINIPPIKIGAEISAPTIIKVIGDADKLKDEPIQINTKEVILKTDINPKEGYINQQILYSVKLYNSQRIMDAEYQPPRVEDALLMPLGDSKRSEVILNGRNYLVEEQQYAIFPQKTGALTITPPSFSALIFEGVPRRITVHGESKKLKIKPTPAHKSKYWFPAKQVSLTETYDQNGEVVGEGTTLVRNITLQASGVPAQLLPPLEFPNSEDFGSYPEKTELNNSLNQNSVIGRAELKITYVLSKNGDIVLPGLKIKWFNTDTGHEETAILPEKTLKVIPKMTESKKKLIAKKKNTEPLEAQELIPQEKLNYGSIGWLLAGFFAVAWITTIILLKKPFSMQKNESKRILKKLQKTSLNNNARETETFLLQWAKLHWPEKNLLNLNQIANLINYTPLKDELLKLSTHLYNPKQNLRWEGARLWNTLQEYNRIRLSNKSKKDELPPINPQG